jgi:hypothetical protein
MELRGSLVYAFVLLLFNYALPGVCAAFENSRAQPGKETGQSVEINDKVIFTDGKADDLAGLHAILQQKPDRVHIVTSSHPDHVKALRHWVTLTVLQGILYGAPPYDIHNKHSKLHFYSTKDNIIEHTEVDTHNQYLLDPDKVIPGVLPQLFKKDDAQTALQFPHAGGRLPKSVDELNSMDDLVRNIPPRANVAIHMIGPTDKVHILKIVERKDVKLNLFHVNAGFNLKQGPEKDGARTARFVNAVHQGLQEAHPEAKIVFRLQQ